MARIALDAMGGDHAPQAPVSGALLAVAELDPTHSIYLVGRAPLIEETLDHLLHGELAALASHRSRLVVVDAPDVIDMAEKPSSAIRAKPKSSMMVGLRLHAEGQCDAFVSAGNTGAQMAASMVLLRMHEGVKRPAIATSFPTAQRPIVVLDSGANVDCSAAELVQFARLGAVYAHDVLGRENPAVGLLNIGEEPEKGTPSRRRPTRCSPNPACGSPATSKDATCPPATTTWGPSTSWSATASWATSCSSSTRAWLRSWSASW